MIKNEHERYVVERLMQSEMFAKLQSMFIDKNVTNENEFVVSQTDFKDNCERMFFITDIRLFAYGANKETFFAELKRLHINELLFESAPYSIMEYTSRNCLYLPMTSLCDSNGKELVNVKRVVELFTEIVADMIRNNTECQVGDIMYTTIQKRGYFYFPYKAQRLGWKSWL